MGFNLKKAIGGTLAGGPGVGYLFGSGALDPKLTTQDQVPLETPEQRESRIMLNNFAKSGSFGKFTAGAEVPIQYGDYNITDTEQSGLSELQKLLSSGIPEQFTLGDNALRDILNPDPNAVSRSFDPFRDQVARNTRDATNSAKRSASYLGNLYSTDAIKRLGDVEARGNESLTAELARLTDNVMGRRLQAVPLAYQAGQAREGLNMGRIQASQQYGGLARNLNDASIKARDAEILRRRQELQLPIEAARTVAGGNSNFGVPSVTTQTPSALMDMLQLLVKGGSTIAGAATRGAG